MSVPKVIIESPYSAKPGYDIGDNLRFARNVCMYAIFQGRNPFASHLFYTQFLDDSDPVARSLGIQLGLQWAETADEVWFCLRPDEEMTRGMEYAFEYYQRHNEKTKWKPLTMLHKRFSPQGNVEIQ